MTHSNDLIIILLVGAVLSLIKVLGGISIAWFWMPALAVIIAFLLPYLFYFVLTKILLFKENQ